MQSLYSCMELPWYSYYFMSKLECIYNVCDIIYWFLFY